MATSRGRRSAPLIEALHTSPERFDFLQAVRILERAAHLSARDSRFEAAGRIGFDHDVRKENVYLRSVPELAFPATEVAAFDDTGKRPTLSVAIMGLNGPSGVLPIHYSLLVLEALRQRSTAIRDFLDGFNHRALSFFARALRKYRLPLAYEGAGEGGDDAISGALYALVGMHGQALRKRQAVSDATLLFYAGHLSHHRRPAEGLARMLSDFFDRPVRIAQFQGRWISLPEREQTVLGGSRQIPGRYRQLGVTAVLGARIWDVQGSFRIRLGPLDYDQFLDFMPNGAQMAELAALTRTYVGPALSYDVQLTLKAAQIPPLRLSQDRRAGPRLGWNTWFLSERPRDDASDAVFRMEAT
jgi:type VI secretion system protein ImpH